MTGGPAMAWACPDGREQPRGGLPDARALDRCERPRGGLPDARALEIIAKEAVK
jgi:hypothetical protein